MPTPATRGERGSLMGGVGSPVPSLDIRRGHGADFAIPGLDINPPTSIGRGGDQLEDAERGERSSPRPEGFGGWITNMVGRRGNSKSRGEQGSYRPLDQDEE
jgi:hypothetical protein